MKLQKFVDYLAFASAPVDNFHANERYRSVTIEAAGPRLVMAGTDGHRMYAAKIDDGAGLISETRTLPYPRQFVEAVRHFGAPDDELTLFDGGLMRDSGEVLPWPERLAGEPIEWRLAIINTGRTSCTVNAKYLALAAAHLETAPVTVRCGLNFLSVPSIEMTAGEFSVAIAGVRD